MKNLIILLAIVFYTQIAANAQTSIRPVVKFGKINADDFKPTDFEKDTSAHAVILYDYASYEYYYSDTHGFMVRYYYHKRIKIVDKKGLELANKIIPYHSGEGANEDVYDVDGYTYNLIDGEVKKDRLSKKSIVDEKKVENLRYRKLAMPNVQVGSIIEFEYYKTTGENFSLADRYFQYNEYPVLWSELEVSYPDYWQYNTTVHGYENMVINTTEKESVQAPFLPARTGSIPTYTGVKRHYAMKNIPAMHEYLYTNTIDNYLAAISFDCVAYKSPFELLGNNFATTWSRVGGAYLGSEKFGGQLNKSFMEKEVKELIKSAKTPIEKTEIVLNWVKKTMKWNGEMGVFPTETGIKKAFDSKKGNTVDINLLLIAALRQADIVASPVLLSTRKNGYVFELHPSLYPFNYVIAEVIIDAKSYLLDATSPASYLNQLPPRCFNNNGFCLKNDKTYSWVSLMPEKSAVAAHRYELKLRTDGSLEGVYKARFTGSEAMSLRETFADMKPDELKKYWETKHKGMTVESMKILNLDTLSKSLNIEAIVKIEGKTQVADKTIYLNPILYDNITENPFKAETRKTPIHYEYIFSTDISVKIDLPEGYALEETPKATNLVLPNNDAKASITFASKPNQVEVLCKMAVNKDTFMPSSYLDLREWYNAVIAKQSEQIVLKMK